MTAEYKKITIARDRHCQAPGCEVKNRLTLDHFTPKCLFKLKYKGKHFLSGNPNSLSNTQALCKPHHIEKDSDTRDRMELLSRQLRGKEYGIIEHMREFGIEPTLEDIEKLLEIIEN